VRYNTAVKKYTKKMKKYKVALKKWQKLKKKNKNLKKKKPVKPKKPKKPAVLSVPVPPKPTAPTPPAKPSVPLYEFEKLSEQHLTSCSKPEPGNGCLGFWPSAAMQWIIEKSGGGQVNDAAFPYNRGQNETLGTCPATLSGPRYPLTKSVTVGHTTAEVQAALMRYGPLSVVIDATPIFLYDSGVIQGGCLTTIYPPAQLHAVTLVGWGVSEGVPVWHIKNSWDRDWGIDGYMMLLRDETNVCGMLNFPYGVEV
jgi:hypothetical protein